MQNEVAVEYRRLSDDSGLVHAGSESTSGLYPTRWGIRIGL